MFQSENSLKQFKKLLNSSKSLCWSYPEVTCFPKLLEQSINNLSRRLQNNPELKSQALQASFALINASNNYVMTYLEVAKSNTRNLYGQILFHSLAAVSLSLFFSEINCEEHLTKNYWPNSVTLGLLTFDLLKCLKNK